ncbi:hypothetical protein J7E90_17180 [Streptomyces sp. ISL-111]|uniref:hypothetical protein n=1 Tax=Streptomyces sp. ISL-111 TaxID=2819175 RepID=UPI001BEA6C3F|nr:hypothetical protein [Streptomyces sp. ISL-111]MBT2379036.1 hypothetical protein [Streptomyces sp. ISL-111]
MPDLLAGSRVLALDTPRAVGAAESASFDATSTAYTTTSTGGSYAEVAVVFTSPTTGRVRLSLAARLINSGTGGSLITVEVRTGAVIGSGTVVDSAIDATGISHYGATFARAGIAHMLSGLTPGSTYNARLLHRVTGGTGSFAMRQLIAEPLP